MSGHEGIDELLAAAKARYAEPDYPGALRLNQQAVDLADVAGSLRYRVMARRYLGVCQYRLADLDGSEESLRTALALATEGGLTHQRIALLNHLGSTLRRQGRAKEALDCLQQGLAEAAGPDELNLRGRLAGNLGALHDELGNRGLAWEHYARYEELMRVTNDRWRLPRALGLSGRQARLHGHLVVARLRVEEERAAAEQLGDPHSLMSASQHEAELLQSELMQEGAALDDPRVGQAQRLFEHALSHAEQMGPNRLASLLCKSVRFELELGSLRTANQLLRRARSLLSDLSDQPVERARIWETAALHARKAGLHGEALEFLFQAVLLRDAATDEGLRPPPAMERLNALLLQTAEEALLVHRSEGEFARLKELLGEERAERLLEQADEGVRSWRRRIDDEAKVRLQRLLGYSLDGLEADAGRDLLEASRVYYGMFDEMSLPVLLLGRTVERELGRRYLPLFRGALSGLGLDRALRPFINGGRPPTLGQWRQLLEARDGQLGREVSPIVERILGDRRTSLLALWAETTTHNGDPVDLASSRNAAAHGRGDITRLQVDALTRHVFLSEVAPLPELFAPKGGAET